MTRRYSLPFLLVAAGAPALVYPIVTYGASIHMKLLDAPWVAPVASTPPGRVLLLLISLAVGALTAIPCLIALGMPAHLLLRAAGWTAGWVYVLAGALVSILSLGALVIGNAVPMLHDGVAAVTVFALPLMLSGPFAAMLFWTAVRPDRQEE